MGEQMKEWSYLQVFLIFCGGGMAGVVFGYVLHLWEEQIIRKAIEKETEKRIPYGG